MARRSRKSSFLPVLCIVSAVLLGLYVTSPVYGGGRNVLLPSRFGADVPLVSELRQVLVEIESASRRADDATLTGLVSLAYAAELRQALAKYHLADAGDRSIRGLGVGPRHFDGVRFGVAEGDVVVVAQDFGLEQHRLWRFVWNGFDFLLDRVEFLARMSSRAELETYARSRLRSRLD